MNALRHLLAPVAAPRLTDGRFYAQVLLSGSHANSLALVQTGQADVCGVDCVTFANLAKHRAEAVYGLRVLARTEQAATSARRRRHSCWRWCWTCPRANPPPAPRCASRASSLPRWRTMGQLRLWRRGLCGWGIRCCVEPAGTL